MDAEIVCSAINIAIKNNNNNKNKTKNNNNNNNTHTHIGKLKIYKLVQRSSWSVTTGSARSSPAMRTRVRGRLSLHGRILD